MTKYAVGALSLILLIISIILCIVARGAPPLSFEISFSLWVQSIDIPGFSPLMVFFTRLGQQPLVFIVVAITAAIFAARGMRLEALFILLTPTGDALDLLLKFLLARPRPTPDLVRVLEFSPDSSFPSGHAVHAVVFFGFLAFLVWSLLKTPIVKYSTLAVLVLIILLTGLSRVYLGAHWLGDVIGGYVIGTLWLIMLISAYCMVRSRWHSVG